MYKLLLVFIVLVYLCVYVYVLDRIIYSIRMLYYILPYLRYMHIHASLFFYLYLSYLLTNCVFTLYSHSDNLRSIPSVIDGLKPSQRKILYACFKKGLTQDMKVVQLAGYVAEQTAYHHGKMCIFVS